MAWSMVDLGAKCMSMGSWCGGVFHHLRCKYKLCIMNCQFLSVVTYPMLKCCGESYNVVYRALWWKTIWVSWVHCQSQATCCILCIPSHILDDTIWDYNMHMNIKKSTYIPTYVTRPTLVYFDFRGCLTFIILIFLISTLHITFSYRRCIMCLVYEIFHFTKLANYKCTLRLMWIIKFTCTYVL